MTLSASKLELALRCVGAFTLPWRDERNSYSDAGNERHAVDEDAINRGDVPVDLAERWPNHTWRSEVAFAYDCSTGEARELGQGIKRDYARFNLTPFEVVGTVDAIGQLGSHIVVHDKKSFDDVTRAKDNPQLRFNALAASRALKATRVEVSLSHELRPLDVAELDAFDLDETAQMVRQLQIDVAKAQQDARDGKPVPFDTGRQCRWCSAFASCPKQSDLVQLVRREDAALQKLEPSELPVLSSENAADVYRLWKQIGMLHKRVGESLYSFASRETVFLGDGRAFGKVVKQGNEKIDGDVAYRVVGETYGQEVADAAVVRSTTKTRLKEALSKVAGKGQLAAVERSVLAAIRAAGGSERAEREVIEEHAVELKLASGGES